MRDVGQAAGEVRLEPGPVGVVADRAAVGEDDGVDRAERLGVGRQLVEVLDHELLAGMGDVEAGEAERAARPRTSVADGLRGEPELADVDAPVDVAQAELVGLALVQRGAQRGADVGADEPDEVAGGLAGVHVRTG